MNKKWMLIFIPILIFLFAYVYLSFKHDIYITFDNEIPTIININETFDVPEAKAIYCKKYFSKKCIDISKYLSIDSNLDTNKIGIYNINYYVKYKNISNNVNIQIEIGDLEAPIIELNNAEKRTICPNYDLNDIQDYQVFDNYDTDIQNKVIKYIEENQLYYSVTDSQGNKTVVNQEIEILDNEAPKLILHGYENMYLLQGTKYEEPGFTAHDNCDGNLTSQVAIEGTVDINTIGEYTITYSVKDSQGQLQTKKRNIHVYNNTIGTNVNKNGKIVYLTFDDGPNAYTKNILDVLKKYQVKATFFVTNQFPNYQYLIKEMYNQGHAIAIHTYSHTYKNIYSSEENYFSDLYKMDEVIYNQTGTHTKLVRFPGGSSNTISKFNNGIMSRLSELLELKGFVYFDWNVDSRDTNTINSETIANNVINGMKNNKSSVVLMHDIKYANKAALEKILYYGLTNGYTFLPLDENSPTKHHPINN